ncbi:hypothetical protein AAES_21386 [Amazona aestiva]|uniref:Uncharacterized protein n=1 Tax=Amazona aestiva TaxID=12930 RepID=A0A0Q3TZV3_AMAAE|nr:hypothetical protein AAES_21386 [Amazona aestiva]
MSDYFMESETVAIASRKPKKLQSYRMYALRFENRLALVVLRNPNKKRAQQFQGPSLPMLHGSDEQLTSDRLCSEVPRYSDAPCLFSVQTPQASAEEMIKLQENDALRFEFSVEHSGNWMKLIVIKDNMDTCKRNMLCALVPQKQAAGGRTVS